MKIILNKMKIKKHEDVDGWFGDMDPTFFQEISDIISDGSIMVEIGSIRKLRILRSTYLFDKL